MIDPQTYLENLRRLNTQTATQPKPRSQRDELVQKFANRLNTHRIADKLKPYAPKRVALLVSHIPTDDLYHFYRQCEQARHFSKFFHWAIKPQKK